LNVIVPSLINFETSGPQTLRPNVLNREPDGVGGLPKPFVFNRLTPRVSATGEKHFRFG
jgi:hypothetical protein